jgi:hypothetical protein
VHKPYLLRFERERERERERAMATMAATQLLMVPIRCSDSNPPRRGFGTKNNTNKVPTYVCMYVCVFISIFLYVFKCLSVTFFDSLFGCQESEGKDKKNIGFSSF